MLEYASSGAKFVGSFEERRFGGWFAAAAPLLGFVRRRPHDALAATVAVLAAGAVALNALWFQPPHPAPMFHGKVRPVAVTETTGSLAVAVPQAAPAAPETKPEVGAPVQPPARSKAATPAPAKQAKRETVPHAPPAKRVAAVQRALADFGYGQVLPTGIADAATKSAIERFERERKLPVTGQLSERVMREVAAVTGRRLD